MIEVHSCGKWKVFAADSWEEVDLLAMHLHKAANNSIAGSMRVVDLEMVVLQNIVWVWLQKFTSKRENPHLEITNEQLSDVYYLNATLLYFLLRKISFFTL